MQERRPEIQRVNNDEGLARAAAGLFARQAREAVADRGRFTVVLSGGSTPLGMYRFLAEAPCRDRVPWDRIEFFWGDERAVPADHPDSNHQRAREALLDRVGVSPTRIHRMRAESSDLDRAAREYEAEIASVFGTPVGGPPPVFDLVFLGLGTDGHTASLYPHTEALKPGDRWVLGNFVPKMNTHRMTMTGGIINRAACVVFHISGEAKREALGAVLEGPDNPDLLPGQRIRPTMGRLLWLVDEAAAAGLKGHLADTVCLAPSILSADFTRLGEHVRQAEKAGASRIHVDVMDGHFVPNISIGTPVVKSLRRVTRLPLETHLMITNPEDYVEPFAEAGSDTIIFHLETTSDPRALAARIRELGMGVGVTIRPATPVETVIEVLDVIDLALIMTVEPGFGGQGLIPETLVKVERLHAAIRSTCPTCELEVDGGVHLETLPRVVRAGARVLVAGSAIFADKDGVATAMERLHGAIPS